MIIGPLYHWAPASRRAAIETTGLQPSSPPDPAPTQVEPAVVPTCALEPLRWVCLGFTPSGAWALSGATLDDAAGAGAWDLWQVTMPLRRPEDPVTIRPEFGPVLREVQVAGPIEPGRLWLVGTRVRRVGGDPWRNDPTTRVA